MSCAIYCYVYALCSSFSNETKKQKWVEQTEYIKIDPRPVSGARLRLRLRPLMLIVIVIVIDFSI